MSSDNENKASLGVNEEEVIGWIRSVLPATSFSDEERSRAEISLTSLSGAGGLSSAHMLKVTVKLDGADRSSFVYKAHNEATVGMSKDMGLAREAYFYRDLSSVLRAQGVLSPLLTGAEGDMETGRFQILMEDLSQTAVQSGYFFGPGSPHNWGKDLTALTSAAASGTSLRDVSLDCFVQMARMHRFYWKKTELWGNSWLRGSSYFVGEGKSIWEGEQDRTNKAWEKCKQQMADGTSQIRFNEHLVQCIDASVAKLDWEQFLEERQQGPWTLVHGDMHPANIMWDYTRASAVEGAAVRGTSVFVDWQVVGIGSGPQDMAQYIISHTSPTDRRLIERELVLAYHKELTTGEGLPEDLRAYSFEQCWKDYVRGGTQRWVWLFCLITSICPAIVSQYFHDQLAAFLEDHGVTPENIGMPI